jgi:hypothetical protein
MFVGILMRVFQISSQGPQSEGLFSLPRKYSRMHELQLLALVLDVREIHVVLDALEAVHRIALEINLVFGED